MIVGPFGFASAGSGGAVPGPTTVAPGVPGAIIATVDPGVAPVAGMSAGSFPSGTRHGAGRRRHRHGVHRGKVLQLLEQILLRQGLVAGVARHTLVAVRSACRFAPTPAPCRPSSPRAGSEVVSWISLSSARARGMGVFCAARGVHILFRPSCFALHVVNDHAHVSREPALLGHGSRRSSRPRSVQKSSRSIFT